MIRSRDPGTHSANAMPGTRPKFRRLRQPGVSIFNPKIALVGFHRPRIGDAHVFLGVHAPDGDA